MVEIDNSQVYDNNKETMYKLVAFIAGCLFIILIALFLTNLGMQKNIDARLSLRNFQQYSQLTDEDERGVNLILDTNTLPKHQITDLISTETGIDDIISIANKYCWSDVDTEDGYIEVLIDETFSDPLPLCIDDAWLDDYYVTIKVYGKYVPVLGESQYIKITQGNDDWPWKQATYYIKIMWEDITGKPGYDKVCCADAYYNATFEVDKSHHPEGKICLAAQNYPDVLDQSGNIIPLEMWKPDCSSTTIPGKEVDIKFKTVWSGCHEEDQYFAYILI